MGDFMGVFLLWEDSDLQLGESEENAYFGIDMNLSEEKHLGFCLFDLVLHLVPTDLNLFFMETKLALNFWFSCLSLQSWCYLHMPPHQDNLFLKLGFTI